MNVLIKYGKALVAILVAVLTLAASAVSDGHFDANEVIQILIAGATAVTVWLVPNLPTSGAGKVKTIVAVLLAILNAAVAYVSDGLDASEIINLVIAGAGVLLIGIAPAQSAGDNLVPRPVAASMSRQAYGGS